MVIIKRFREQFVHDQGLAKGVHSLQLLKIANVLNRDGANTTIALSPATLLSERVFEFGRCIERFLFERSNSGPPLILGVLEVRSPLLLLITAGKPLKACQNPQSNSKRHRYIILGQFLRKLTKERLTRPGKTIEGTGHCGCDYQLREKHIKDSETLN